MTVVIRSAESKEFVRGGEFSAAYLHPVPDSRQTSSFRAGAACLPGAPTQVLWARLGWICTVLEMAFGFGLWQSAGRNRAIRIVGGLILAPASLGLLWPFATMHQREVLAAGGGTLSDTLHVVLAAVTVFLMFLAIGFGGTAFGKPFRLYSIVTIVVLLVFGGLTFLEAPRLQANLPTPWIVCQNCVRYPPKPWGNRLTARMLSNLAAAKSHRPAHVTFRSPIPSHRWRQEQRHVRMGTTRQV